MAREELLDAEEYEDIADDIACEIEGKYGAFRALEIPQPTRGPPSSTILLLCLRRYSFKDIELN